jgi:hypothetical protein
VNGVQIKILNFLAKLSLNPAETMSMAVTGRGARWHYFMETAVSVALTKLKKGGKVYTSGAHSFRMRSLLCSISYFLFTAKNKCTATKVIVLQKQNTKTSQRKAVHVVYILLFP